MASSEVTTAMEGHALYTAVLHLAVMAFSDICRITSTLQFRPNNLALKSIVDRLERLVEQLQNQQLPDQREVVFHQSMGHLPVDMEHISGNGNPALLDFRVKKARLLGQAASFAALTILNLRSACDNSLRDQLAPLTIIRNSTAAECVIARHTYPHPPHFPPWSDSMTCAEFSVEPKMKLYLKPDEMAVVGAIVKGKWALTREKPATNSEEDIKPAVGATGIQEKQNATSIGIIFSSESITNGRAIKSRIPKSLVAQSTLLAGPKDRAVSIPKEVTPRSTNQFTSTSSSWNQKLSNPNSNTHKGADTSHIAQAFHSHPPPAESANLGTQNSFAGTSPQSLDQINNSAKDGPSTSFNKSTLVAIDVQPLNHTVSLVEDDPNTSSKNSKSVDTDGVGGGRNVESHLPSTSAGRANESSSRAAESSRKVIFLLPKDNSSLIRSWRSTQASTRSINQHSFEFLESDISKLFAPINEFLCCLVNSPTHSNQSASSRLNIDKEDQPVVELSWADLLVHHLSQGNNNAEEALGIHKPCFVMYLLIDMLERYGYRTQKLLSAKVVVGAGCGATHLLKKSLINERSGPGYLDEDTLKAVDVMARFLQTPDQHLIRNSLRHQYKRGPEDGPETEISASKQLRPVISDHLPDCQFGIFMESGVSGQYFQMAEKTLFEHSVFFRTYSTRLINERVIMQDNPEEPTIRGSIWDLILAYCEKSSDIKRSIKKTLSTDVMALRYMPGKMAAINLWLLWMKNPDQDIVINTNLVSKSNALLLAGFLQTKEEFTDKIQMAEITSS